MRDHSEQAAIRGGRIMWKILKSLGLSLELTRERSAEVQNITNLATSFRLHFDHAMSAAAELHDMISASQRDLNDAFARLRAAVPASPSSHLITEESETVSAGEGNGRASERRVRPSAA
jgi:hypothetical protein